MMYHSLKLIPVNFRTRDDQMDNFQYVLEAQEDVFVRSS